VGLGFRIALQQGSHDGLAHARWFLTWLGGVKITATRGRAAGGFRARHPRALGGALGRAEGAILYFRIMTTGVMDSGQPLRSAPIL
jgi:hypothetical protein